MLSWVVNSRRTLRLTSPGTSVPFDLQLSTLNFSPRNSFISFSLRTLFPSTRHGASCNFFLFFHLQTLCRHNRRGLPRHIFKRFNRIEKTDNSNFVNELSLCRHRTLSGRRCRPASITTGGSELISPPRRRFSSPRMVK